MKWSSLTEMFAAKKVLYTFLSQLPAGSFVSLNCVEFLPLSNEWIENIKIKFLK
jgi:hypothetical protein